MRVRGVKQREFTEFYRSDQAACLRAVLVSVGDRQLAEDLVAEAFTRAWTSWPKVRRHPSPRAWIVRTALNARISWWRRRRREVAWDGAPEVEAVTSGSQDRSAPQRSQLSGLALWIQVRRSAGWGYWCRVQACLARVSP
jgi:DNA-directed RNA polymerase specialized sigma24 family protein